MHPHSQKKYSTTMDNLDFYKNLTSFNSFDKAFEPRYYRDVPDNWLVLIADIVDSTQAIDSGAYKSVNFVGSLPIIAVINLCNRGSQFDKAYEA